MEKRIKEKLHALDPRFRKRFSELMSMMEESISLLYDAVNAWRLAAGESFPERCPRGTAHRFQVSI